MPNVLPEGATVLKRLWVVVALIHMSQRFRAADGGPIEIHEEPYWFLPAYESRDAAERAIREHLPGAKDIQEVTMYVPAEFA